MRSGNGTGGIVGAWRLMARAGMLCVLVLTAGLLCAATSVWGVGCGRSGVSDHGASSASSALPAITSGTCASAEAASSASTGPQELESRTPSTSDATSFVSVHECFAALAARMAPVAVYAPAGLPMSARVDAEYFPLLTCVEPSEYQGPKQPNPLVTGSVDQASAEVLVRTDEAWMVFLENFRGDLGDVSGTHVGDVQGHPAHSYEIAGGVVVQWSDTGRWYGVFSRDIPAEQLAQIALDMRVLQP